MLMSAAEAGAYMRMLCYQWLHGACPTDEKDLAKIAGMRFTKLQRVLKKFRQTAEGLQEAWLEETRAGLESYRDLASKGGAVSSKKRTGDSQWGKQMAAKRYGAASSDANEPATNPDPANDANRHAANHANRNPANRANTISKSISNSESISESKSLSSDQRETGMRRDTGLWPAVEEYPTLAEVKAWAETAMVGPEIAAAWHASRHSMPAWTDQHGKPLPTDRGLLRAIFGSYATACRAKQRPPTGSGPPRTRRPCEESDVDIANMREL
jgi:uncharacterized protein YdaU (DUF1376 family)